MKTLIRADSSATIGLGHIMRDLVLAQGLEGEVLFACQALEGNIIERIPYEVKRLSSNDVEELIELIQSLHVSFLVIDHYGIKEADERRIKEATNVKMLVFDDTYEPHCCDILLNHNVCADASRYEGLIPKNCELRCGSAYTLIRDEFKAEKHHVREKRYDVLVAMGGTDASNVTQAILETLPQNQSVAVLTTSANSHLKALQSYVEKHPNVTLHVNSNDVAKIMNQSRLAVITPSVIAHEVLFMQIPFIAIKVAPNQDDMYAYLRQNAYAVLEAWNASAFQALLTKMSL